MRRTQHESLASILLLGLPLVAQSNQARAVTEPDPKQWFAELRDDQRAWRAAQRIAAQGAPVVLPLLEFIDQRIDVSDEDRGAAMAIFALVKVGDPARSAAPRLFEMLAKVRVPGVVERQL